MTSKSILFLTFLLLLGKEANGKRSTGTDEPTSYFQEESLQKLFNNQLTFDDYLSYSMRALKQIAGFDNDLHRYDAKSDLINSFSRNLSYSDDLDGLRAHIDLAELELLQNESELTLIENEKNQALCGLHLDALIEQSRKLYTNFDTFSSSKQLNLLDYLDSFGSPSAQLLKGNSMWLGSHEQCRKSKLTIAQTGTSETFGARYCVANFRSPIWIRDLPEQDVISDRSGGESIKLGLCLPESCNSISILRHKKRIDSLVKINKLNQVPYSSYRLTHLFCLPDENSPLRQFSLSAKLFILLLSSWLTVVFYFSIKYEYLRMKWLNSLTRNNVTEDKMNSQTFEQLNSDNCMKIFAFRLSWSRLFESNDQTRSFVLKSDININEQTSKESSAATNKVFSMESEQESGIESSDSETVDSVPETKASVMVRSSSNPTIKQVNMIESIKAADLINGLKTSPNLAASLKPTKEQSSAIVTVNPSQQKNQTQSSSSSSEPASIDLSAIDGIKVLSMIWLISAHTLLFFIRTISNGRDFWAVLKDARFMTIMAGIFPVDTFFTITGILTAFLKFNKNNGQAMTKTKYWIETFFHRYLRFMPMYLIVFWYTRDVSEYISFGPLWDYATADTSLRSMCKQESVFVPLAFQANFKPIDQHCVKPAWYLANDYQYLLITPLFMALIMKSAVLGYSVIGVSIATSLILQFLTVFYTQEMDDFGALINFKPMFGTYVLKNLWRLYVLPYNRIPPYLIGIITGHIMYSFNKTSQDENKQLHQVPLASHLKHQDSTSDIVNNMNEKQSSDTPSNAKTPTAIQSNSLFEAFGSYICIKIWIPLMFLISIIYLPMITRVFTQEGVSAKIGTSSIIAAMRFIWSLAIARLIYICATRFLENNPINKSDSFVIRFLSSPKWKPWSKIGLSALLIQWEIISYLAQSQTYAPNITITFLSAIILVCIVATYSLALLIYLTIEYPLSQIEHFYIHPVFFHKR